MQEYILIFRMDITSKEAQPTAEQMEEYMIQWMAWVNDIAGKGKLAGGNHMANEGKLLRPGGVITDGPYTAGRESVTGYLIIHAKDMEDALSIAKKCPILNGEGTSVEVRQTATPGEMRGT